jgi:hypothetical protein
MLAAQSSRSSAVVLFVSVGSGAATSRTPSGDAHPFVVGRGDRGQGSVARCTPPLATGYLRDMIPKLRAKGREQPRSQPLAPELFRSDHVRRTRTIAFQSAARMTVDFAV